MILIGSILIYETRNKALESIIIPIIVSLGINLYLSNFIFLIFIRQDNQKLDVIYQNNNIYNFFSKIEKWKSSNDSSALCGAESSIRLPLTKN